MSTEKTLDNWTMVLNTVKTLSTSQGFYSRLQQEINQFTPEQIQEYKEQINNLPMKFKNPVDVILWIEQL